MTRGIKTLIGILIIFLAGGILGWYYYLNKVKITTPKIEIIAPSQLEVAAYKEISFSFLIENKKDSLKAEKVNVTIEGVKGEINPNNIDLLPGESQNFEVRLSKLEPGEYTLDLKVSGESNINITKSVIIKSLIIVGFDQYHISERFWEEPVTYPNQSGLKFISYLKENNIKAKIIESELTKDSLKDINVLVITKPDQPFLSKEKETLKEFLDQGGGVLLVGLFGDSAQVLNDLVKFLNINLKFNADYLFPNEWTKDISEHQITSGIESIIYRGCSLSIKEPIRSLVKQDGKTVYAILQYSNGKIGAIGGYFMLRDDHLNICRQCQKLNLNLIKWLATPETLQDETVNWKIYTNQKLGVSFKIPQLFEEVGYKIEETEKPYYYFKNQTCNVIYFKTKPINPPFPERIDKNRLEPLFTLFICSQKYCEDEDIKEICDAIKENKLEIPEKDITLFTSFITQNDKFFVFEQGCPSCGDVADFMGWSKEPVKSLKEKMLSTFKFIEMDETLNWKTYRNEKYGFEIRYPEGGKVSEIWENYIELPSASIYFPATTTPEGKEIKELSVKPTAYLKIDEACLSPITEGMKVSVGNIEFQFGTSDEGAAGSIYHTLSYLYRNNKVFCLNFVFRYPSGLGVFYPEIPIGYSERYNQEIRKQIGLFDEMTEKMLSTFKFLE